MPVTAEAKRSGPAATLFEYQDQLMQIQQEIMTQDTQSYAAAYPTAGRGMLSSGTAQTLTSAGRPVSVNATAMLNQNSQKSLPHNLTLDPAALHYNQTLRGSDFHRAALSGHKSDSNLQKIATLKETYHQLAKYQSQLAKHGTATPTALRPQMKQARKSALIVSRDQVTNISYNVEPVATTSYATI